MNDGKRETLDEKYIACTDIRCKAGFPSNAMHAMHARKYVTNAVNATHVRIASSSQ